VESEDFMRIVVFTTLVALLLAGSAGAAPLANPLITVNEFSIGTIQFPGQSGIALVGTPRADPGPGGLASALTYNLLGPPSLVAGDVLIQELIGAELVLSDIIRFNPAGTGDNSSYPASLVFYSDNGGGVAGPADTGFPTGQYTNVLTTVEVVGLDGVTGLVYTPTANQPGFVPGFDVAYNIVSDVPEPASISLFAIGGGLLLVGTRWMKRA
jgi:hypothetical protein